MTALAAQLTNSLGRHDHTNAPCALASRGFFIAIHERWHYPQTLERLRPGSSAGRIRHGLVHPRLRMSPALFRFEPPSGLILLFLLACLLFMTFLRARSGFFHHPFTPARLSG